MWRPLRRRPLRVGGEPPALRSTGGSRQVGLFSPKSEGSEGMEPCRLSLSRPQCPHRPSKDQVSSSEKWVPLRAQGRLTSKLPPTITSALCWGSQHILGTYCSPQTHSRALNSPHPAGRLGLPQPGVWPQLRPGDIFPPSSPSRSHISPGTTRRLQSSELGLEGIQREPTAARRPHGSTGGSSWPGGGQQGGGALQTQG